MSASKHTPGPWSLELDDVPYDGGFETYVINSENGSICMLDCPQDDMNANGRLIAAAPDLLEIAEIAVKDCPGENCCIAWHTQARAIIAKAKGES